MKRYVCVFALSCLCVFMSAATTKQVIDLSSETAWKLQIDGKGKMFPVNVPYGGWNSDRQHVLLDENTDVKDYVVYSREIQIPDSIKGKVVKIHFGAVNFGAEVYIDGHLVATHHSNFTAFDADITPYVQKGRSHSLKVKAYVLNHYKDENGKYTMPTGYIYDNKLVKYPFGIARKVELHVYPRVYIEDVFVKPSVSLASLSYDVWIANSTEKEECVSLSSRLTSWKNKHFAYPHIADTVFNIPAQSTVCVQIKDIPWQLGKDSYWWPNVPFDENYEATLHYLNLELSVNGNKQYELSQRFGFVEHAEGPFYYTVNGVRVNLPSDASAVTQGCVYDGYAEAEAFRYSETPDQGCQETWKRYMRLGIRANRTHQEPPTQNMLDAADEVGFILIPETAIRGSHYPQSNDPKNPYYRQHIQDMVRECRNHPSVARYSLSNELHAVPEYLDMALVCDNTRPYVFESNTHGETTRVVSKLGHAYVMTHYVDYPRPANGIYGLGEYAWSTDGINEFASQGKLMRMNDICYYSGWSWTNYWPNFLEGWSHDTYAWKQNNHSDRVDGVDGWNSPLIAYVQKSLHPYLVCDKEIEAKNRFSDTWPDVVPVLKPGEQATRHLVVFNDVLFGEDLRLLWSACWDGPDGEIIQQGTEMLNIRPGFLQNVDVCLNVPVLTDREERRLFLVLMLEKDGKTVFMENAVWYNVTAKKPLNDIQFIGIDSITRGNWKGVYGTEGYDIAGAERKLAGYVSLQCEPADVWCWKEHTDDPRALQRFVNDGNTGISRIAATYSRYGNIVLTVDVGDQYRQLAIYCMDWDRDYRQPVYIPSTDQKLSVDNFKNGKYLLFRVRGKVSVVVGDERTSNICGVFIDKL